MSTTMMNHPRRFLAPTSSNKRKERSGPDAPRATKIAKPTLSRLGAPSTSSKQPEAAPSNNQLLAGYLAHEFLTKGTLFGRAWDPARAEAVPELTSARLNKPKKAKKAEVQEQPPPHQPSTSSVKAEAQLENHQTYLEVADLLKSDGVHIPGIVNPTQLFRFLQL